MDLATPAAQTLRKMVDNVLKYELFQSLNRASVNVASGQSLLCGAVIGMVLVSASAASAAGTGNIGNGVMGTVTPGDAALRGRYIVTIVEPGTNVGQFTVTDPNGLIIGHGTVATAFDNDQLAFTLADGSTDFAAGDYFTIDVYGGTESWGEYDPAHATLPGRKVPQGVLLEKVDASGGAVLSVALVRGPAIVALDGLAWKSGLTDAQKSVGIQLLTKNTGIVVLDAI